MKRKRIQISVLTNGWIRKELAMKLIQWLRKCPYDIYLEFTEERPIAHCRNRIVRDFLKRNYDFLLMIDNDVVPEKNPLDLVELDKDVIILPCPIYQAGRIIWNVYRLDKEGYWRPINLKKEKRKLIKIEAGGTGSILIKKNVLQKIDAPFERVFTKKGIEKMGLDLFFSRKLKEKGFSIYASVRHKCSHYKTLDLRTIQNKWLTIS